MNVTNQSVKEILEKLMENWGFCEIPQNSELKVYGKVVFTNTTLRIYAPLSENNIIRLNLVHRLSSGSIIEVGYPQEIYPMENWQKTLKRMIETWDSYAGPICPNCSSYMKERTGRYGLFLGCITFPKCRGTLGVTSTTS